MSYQRFGIYILAPVVAMLAAAQPAWADTAVMTFQCGTGRLDLKTAGAGDLIASGNRAVFTGANTTFLSDGNGQPQISGGTVTVNMTGFSPAAVEPANLEIIITDGATTVTATVTDIEDDGFPDVLLTDGENVDGVEFFAPNSGTNFMTLEYNPVSNTVTLTIQGFQGDTATLTGVTMGNVQMGVRATGSEASFNDIAFAGSDVPLFPPLFNAANPWVDFAAGPCGNGAQTYPFDTLEEGVNAAESGATISIVPGTQSGETFTGANAIDTPMALTNAEPGNGTAWIGFIGRRSESTEPARTGFVARPRSKRP